MTYNEVKKLFEDSGCVLLEREYINKKLPMQYRCKCGRIDYKKLKHINPKLGVQCFQCSLHSGESHHMWNPNREAVQMRKTVHDKCRAALRNSLKRSGKSKTQSTHKYVKFSTQDLIKRLESFPNWHVLKNQNWELDHIFPVKAFIEHGIHNPELINSLDNLQPLAREENLTKADRYDEEEFTNWLTQKEQQ